MPNPAKAIGAAQRLGSLGVGREADISVLERREGDWVVYDVLGASLRVTQAVVPFVTVKRGQVFTPDWGPRPWGWEPDPALPAGTSTTLPDRAARRANPEPDSFGPKMTVRLAASTPSPALRGRCGVEASQKVD